MMSSQEVPQGYKQTKVGVIPEEWEVARIGDVFNFIKTYSNSRKDLSAIGDIEYLHYGDIHTKYKYHLNFDKNTLPKISLEKFKTNIQYVENGDLFIADASEDYVDIGKSVEAINLNDKKVVSGLHTFLLRDKDNNFSNGYKGLILYNQNISKNIKRIATGISVLGISKTNLGKLEIPLPPLKEQQKIANILTTWDNAVSKQDELIKAKEELKKGLMQKLLSGEVRFEGFINEWVETKLSNYIVEISKKNKDKKISLVLTVSTKHGFISQEDYFDREIASKDTSNYKIVKKGDFAYNPSRINIGSISYLDTFEEGILSPMYVIFKCNDNLNSSYFTYWLNTHSFKGNLYKYLSGSVRDSLSFRDMKLMKIRLPLLQEQQKIAEVLANADKEINLLKNELEELKEQKKGLMQKLLTGEVRVKT